MINNYHILIIITNIFICIIFFLLGYLLGRINNIDGVSINRTNSIKENKLPINTDIVINDTKYVTDIKTDKLEKKYDTLGELKKSNDNINQSIDKLKKLKG